MTAIYHEPTAYPDLAGITVILSTHQLSPFPTHILKLQTYPESLGNSCEDGSISKYRK